jgi:hypothetical protein
MKQSLLVAILVSIAFATASWLLPAQAQASSGTITGRFVFTQMQLNCGVGTGTKYPCTEQGQTSGARRARVEVRRASDGQTLGTNFTDSTGTFSVGWTDNTATGNVSVTLRWRPIHADGRFQIGNNVGALWALNVSGTTTAINGGPTPIGTKNWGNNRVANVYDGAVKMWENSLSQSNRMLSFFGNLTPGGAGATQYVDIRTEVDDGSCPTGAATDDLNRICLPTSAYYENQFRVMHEMGHLASFRATRDQTAFARADTSLNGSGWNATSGEWFSRQFTEGVATALGNVGLYFANASQPFSCGSDTQCDAAVDGLNLETSSNCATLRRAEISNERYFWDIYDSSADGSDNLNRGVFEIVDTIHAFDLGTGNAQKSEVGASITDPDGHSTLDFVNRWIVFGTNSTAVLTQNCTPSGQAIDTATTGCTPAGGNCPAPD